MFFSPSMLDVQLVLELFRSFFRQPCCVLIKHLMNVPMNKVFTVLLIEYFNAFYRCAENISTY